MLNEIKFYMFIVGSTGHLSMKQSVKKGGPLSRENYELRQKTKVLKTPGGKKLEKPRLFTRYPFDILFCISASFFLSAL